MDEIVDILEDIQNGQLENDLEEEPVMHKEDLLDQTEEEGFPDSMMVYSSGTNGDPTPMPYHRDYLPKTVQTNVKALKIAGMKPEDRKLNLGAPFPHMSAWAFREGTKFLGAETVNHSFEDIDVPDEKLKQEISDYANANTLVGLPRVVNALGDRIEEKTDTKPRDIFETMEKAFFVGDMVSEDIREDLEKQWGFQKAREFYGSTETDIMAASVDESRDMVPILDDYVIEIQKPGTGEIKDIRDAEAGERGSILVTDPNRKAVELTRYELGDEIEVTENEDGQLPRIKVLGRGKDVLNLGGALVYDSTIDEVVSGKWRAVKYSPESTNDLNLDLYVNDPENFDIRNLYDIAPAVEEVDRWDVVNEINLRDIDEYEAYEEGNKENRIVDRV